jgi:hypothetical protein
MISKENKKPKKDNTEAIALAISTGSTREAKLSALHLLLEFDSREDKEKARQELTAIAYGSSRENVSAGGRTATTIQMMTIPVLIQSNMFLLTFVDKIK